MLVHLRPAVVMLSFLTVITGVVYPFAITGVGQVIFPFQANGSVVLKHGPVGSALIGQAFTSDTYFHPRPSATQMPDPSDPTKTVAAPYNAANSGASNLGPTSQALLDRVKGDVEALKASGVALPVPADAVTTSASGLDPDISPDYAHAQVARVAKARKMADATLHALVQAHTQLPSLGFIGEPRVNVLALNMALDAY